MRVVVIAQSCVAVVTASPQFLIRPQEMPLLRAESEAELVLIAERFSILASSSEELANDK